MAQGDAGGNVETLCENRGLIGFAIAVGVLENFDPIAALTRSQSGVFDAFSDPNAAALVETHGDRIHQHGFACDQVDLEALGNFHLANGLGWLQGRPG